MKKAEKKIYCRECGARGVRQKPEIRGYDPATGKPIFFIDYKCPNDRWWNDGHVIWYWEKI